MPPSRQERRSAKRDAAKRTPAQTGAAGAAGAAAASANLHVNVNPGGDWTTQNEDPMLLFQALGDADGGHGGERVRQKAEAYTRPRFSST
jgi:hypothetical protein